MFNASRYPPIRPNLMANRKSRLTTGVSAIPSRRILPPTLLRSDREFSVARYEEDTPVESESRDNSPPANFKKS